MSQRSFIRRAVAASLGLFGTGQRKAQAGGQPATLTILHTNDLHGHLTPQGYRTMNC